MALRYLATRQIRSSPRPDLRHRRRAWVRDNGPVSGPGPRNGRVGAAGSRDPNEAVVGPATKISHDG